jgi:hypothetical protein
VSTLRHLVPGGSAAHTGIYGTDPDEAIDRNSQPRRRHHHIGATSCRGGGQVWSDPGTTAEAASAEAG